MNQAPISITPQRFAEGRTYDEFVAYVATPENLAREGNDHAPRRDMSAALRDALANRQLLPDQAEALRWLAQQPGAPQKLLVIAEEWSSDCRRDLPSFARIAEVMGLEMRIFTRDGKAYSESRSPSRAEAPDSNADLMAQLMNHKNGETYQSLPVAAFLAADLQLVYKYQEFPAIYEKDRILYGHFRASKAGETPEQTSDRAGREFGAYQASPFFRILQSAAVDEIASALWRKLVLGAV